MLPYHVREPQGDAVPLLVSIPHTGTEVPAAIAERFASPEVAALPDTDWHLHVLYDFVPRLGARTVYARYSRYVVDLNRPPSPTPLYPGRFETGVVPVRTFDDAPIYRDGREPDAGEVEERIARYWRPYHERLRTEIDGLKARFGYALLFDAHSIRSVVPKFYDRELPGLMLGDVGGTSCAPAISGAVLEVHAQSGYSWQPNAPFQGGYITRAFGRPHERVHAVQLEMSQRLYMDEAPPYRYREDLARELQPTLEATLRALLHAAEEV